MVLVENTDIKLSPINYGEEWSKMPDKDQEFVDFVVKNLVTHPDDVSTKRTVDEMGVLVELTVNPEDMGQVIGKEGQTAKALRTLLRVMGAKNNARINLKIIEPVGGKRSEAPAEDKKEEPEA